MVFLAIAGGAYLVVKIYCNVFFERFYDFDIFPLISGLFHNLSLLCKLNICDETFQCILLTYGGIFVHMNVCVY